jgi:hypothetical protein
MDHPKGPGFNPRVLFLAVEELLVCGEPGFARAVCEVVSGSYELSELVEKSEYAAASALSQAEEMKRSAPVRYGEAIIEISNLCRSSRSPLSKKIMACLAGIEG